MPRRKNDYQTPVPTHTGALARYVEQPSHYAHIVKKYILAKEASNERLIFNLLDAIRKEPP